MEYSRVAPEHVYVRNNTRECGGKRRWWYKRRRRRRRMRRRRRRGEKMQDEKEVGYQKGESG